MLSCHQDVDTGDRTFNSILSLLVGRQSVSQTLRLLRQEVGVPRADTESSSGNVFLFIPSTINHY